MFVRTRFLGFLFRRSPLPWIVFAVCTALTLVVFLHMRDLDRRRLELRLQVDSEMCRDMLDSDIHNNLHAIEHLETFLLSVSEVERRAFVNFAAKVREDHAAIRALEWIPRVPHDRRNEYEAAARRDGLPDFQFTERSDGQGMVPAGRRAEYFPVYFVEPFESNKAALGYDLASESIRKAMLEAARDSGAACASQPVTLVQQDRSQRGLLVAKPVYHGQEQPDSVAARREKLKGYVMAVVDLNDVVGALIARRSGHPLQLILCDPGAPSSNRLIHPRSSKPEQVDAKNLFATGPGSAAGIMRAMEIKVADRTWSLVCAPGAGNDDYTASSAPWFLLIGGVLLGALISAYISGQRNQTETVSKLVQVRTQELESEVEMRREAEAALVQSEANYRIVADNTYDWEYWISPENKMMYCSPSCERITGYPAGEFIADFRLLGRIVHPEDKAAFETHLGCVVNFCAAPASQAVFRIVCRDGRVCWIHHLCQVARDSSGKVVGRRASNRDITESKMAEERLRLSEENQMAFFNTVHDMLFVLDGDGKILRVNETVVERLGYAEEELMGRSVLDVHPEDRREEAGRIMAGMLAGGMEFCPVPLRAKDGKLISVETRVSPGRWNNKPAMFGTCKDVTALRLSEEKFSKVFRLNPSPMAITTMPELRFLDVNSAFLKVTGYTRSEVIGFTSAELSLSIRPEFEMETHRAITESGSVCGVEVAVRCKSGDIRYGLFFAEAIELHGEHVLLSVMHDITERKRAEERERTRRKVLEMLAAGAPLGKTLEFIARSIEGDLPGAIVSILLVSEDGQRLCHGAAPGLPEFYNNAMDGLVIGDGAGSCGTAAATGKAVVVEDVRTHSCWVPFRDLTRRAGVGACWSVPVFSLDGRVLATFAIYHRQPYSPDQGEQATVHRATEIIGNVLEYHRAKTALQASEMKYRLLFEHSRDALMTTSVRDWRFTSGNPTTLAMFGVKSEADFVSRGPWEFSPEFQPDGRRSDEKAREMLETAIRAGSHLFEWTHQRLTGETFPATVLLNRIELTGETFIQATVRDISEQKRALEELLQAKAEADSANKAKSQFLARMSHEIRTPLNAVLGFAQLMLRDSGLMATDRQRLESIRSNGEHLLALITDILDMSRIETGRLALQTSDFDLLDMFQEVEAMFRDRAHARQLQFGMEVMGEMPHFVYGDPGKIRQVLINLVGNAIKFTSRGGIMVRVREVEGDGRRRRRVRVEVEDTGSGILPEEIGRLFQPFAQAGESAQAAAGSGLGLYISRQFARLMGGSVTATSQIGVGSVFRFDFEVEAATSPSGRREGGMGRVKALRPGEPPCRVLIVDDVKDNRALLDQMLSAAGFVCGQAANGLEALEGLKAWKPHLVLMDVQMPGMDGNETIRRIRAGAKEREVKIIGITANAFEEDRLATLAAGADDFLAKPIRLEDLCARIKVLLGVEYLYEDEPEAAGPGSGSSHPVLLTREAMASLPVALRKQMHEAVLIADFDRVMELIQQVDAQAPLVASSLRQLAGQFDSETLLALTETETI